MFSLIQSLAHTSTYPLTYMQYRKTPVNVSTKHNQTLPYTCIQSLRLLFSHLRTCKLDQLLLYSLTNSITHSSTHLYTYLISYLLTYIHTTSHKYSLTRL